MIKGYGLLLNVAAATTNTTSLEGLLLDWRCKGILVKIVNSMKYGKTLVISMQNSAADIIGCYNCGH